MARPKNEKTHLSHREKLLEAGERAFRETSFSESGINEILAASGVPKGSFYHHFPSKEAFGIAVADRYSEAQLATAKTVLEDASLPPIDRLRAFFEGARTDMGNRNFQQGCLVCNLSTELADEKPAFQAALDAHWRALTAVLEDCLAKAELSELGLQHLTPAQAADWLLNSWSGALTRMKIRGNDEPLALFMQTVFRPKDLKT
ncbi:TetR/AcrR family transcriptional regulator [Tritonibacter horizontis]|uniref:Transcriptional regulator AcuR n=1 Tax=Tritonibacter horizontis TaxID=1768241 RepID=A0A132C137_9RHOB|nr:TetR/AcrR family transcriptional regulator [Tritonibacter horizontis]KUP94042.1 transcriptional regulator AcuR [Tritonibacter horizontis]